MESDSAGSFTRKSKEDRISSELPESLISQILSFLPTKDAVRTSVLSKRWTHRWTTLTNLNLQDSVFCPNKIPNKRKGGNQNFINFVNRALALTNGSTMESFSLLIGDKYDVSVLNTWISSILSRGVKNLHISTHFKLPFSPLTSYYLFESESLEELVIDICGSPIKVPPLDCDGWLVFHKLRLLKFCETICTFDSSLRLYLPNLKKFETRNCSWLSASGGNVTVTAPLLESIVIVHRLELSVWNAPRSCEIHFYDTQLKEFSYCGVDGISQNIILSPPSSARNASANITFYTSAYIKFYRRYKSIPETGSFAFLLFKQLSQVKSIKFYWSKVFQLVTQPSMTHHLPMFTMLCHLQFELVITCEVLLAFLQNSPLLNTLIVNKGISEFDKELLNTSVVPDCFTSTLQIVKFGVVDHDRHLLNLAKFFLENGTVLERMSFSHDSRFRTESKVIEEFKEKLFSFKKGFFSFAIIEFSCRC